MSRNMRHSLSPEGVLHSHGLPGIVVPVTPMAGRVNIFGIIKPASLMNSYRD